MHRYEKGPAQSVWRLSVWGEPIWIPRPPDSINLFKRRLSDIIWVDTGSQCDYTRVQYCHVSPWFLIQKSLAHLVLLHNVTSDSLCSSWGPIQTRPNGGQ